MYSVVQSLLRWTPQIENYNFDNYFQNILKILFKLENCKQSGLHHNCLGFLCHYGFPFFAVDFQKMNEFSLNNFKSLLWSNAL